MADISTVIFDLGGVLIDWNPRYLFRKIFQDEETLEHFLSDVCSPDWNEQQDAGRSLAEATTLLVERFPGYEPEIRAYYDRWVEMLAGDIPGTVSILEELRESERHRLLALTNWSAETFHHALDRFEFLDHFEDILVSGHVKLKKPDPRIFSMMLDNHDLAAESAVFIDDSTRNVAAASACGLHAIHFQHPQQLRRDLVALGVLS